MYSWGGCLDRSATLSCTGLVAWQSAAAIWNGAGSEIWFMSQARFAQFLLLGVGMSSWIGYQATNRGEVPQALVILSLQFFFVNFYWPILNLLPVWPLDGGRISRETFEWLMPERGTATSLIVSMIVA